MLGVALQILLLAGTGPGALLASGACGWAAWNIWHYRAWLGTHVDMIVLMCGYGGLGMLQGAPQCHDTMAAWLKMTAGMLVLSLPPVLFGSRCFKAARRAGNAAGLLILDSIGMTAGMAAMHFPMGFISPSPLVKHFVMVFGMAAGMVAGSASYVGHPRRKDSNIRYARNKQSFST